MTALLYESDYEEYDATFWLVLALFIVQLLLAVFFFVYLNRKLSALRVAVSTFSLGSFSLAEKPAASPSGYKMRDDGGRPSLYFEEPEVERKATLSRV
jgi:hypothetical protein